MPKRKVEILVLSDIHLGTYGCHAKELLHYLESIDPDIVILNGDIVDIWQFSKRYWPASHMGVVQHLINYIMNEKPVYFIPGNHDEVLRRFKGMKLGSLFIDNKLILKLNNQKLWIFHGDVFDVVMEHSKWLAKMGAVGYDTLILINRAVNWINTKLGRGKISLSKKVKNSVKSAVAFINKFEQNIANIAADSGYHTVICGHIHEPTIKQIRTDKHPIMYLNSGDWIENLSSLEYNNGAWSIYKYSEDPAMKTTSTPTPHKAKAKQSLQEIIEEMLAASTT